MANNFVGSIAQENVTFNTSVTTSIVSGENMYSVAVYIDGRDVVPDSSWENFSLVLPALNVGMAYKIVTKDTYQNFVQGQTADWLADLFRFIPSVLGTLGKVYIIKMTSNVFATTWSVDYQATVQYAYSKTKALAQFKTICVNNSDDEDYNDPGDVELPCMLYFATLCNADSDLLSAPALYPCKPGPATKAEGVTILTKALSIAPEVANTLIPDAYNQLSSDCYVYSPYHLVFTYSKVPVFQTATPNVTANPALFQLGFYLADVNASGTPIGRQLDYFQTSSYGETLLADLITTLDYSGRQALKEHNIGYFQYVDDISGNVSPVGSYDTNNQLYPPYIIVRYVAYMVKNAVARILTTVNTFKDSAAYARILQTLSGYLALFGDVQAGGSGRLKSIVISAPAFENLPTSASDQIIIPNAWSATYIDNLHSVVISGDLQIGE